MALRARINMNLGTSFAQMAIIPKEGQEPQTPDSIQQAERLIEEYRALSMKLRELQKSLINLGRATELSVAASNTLGAILSFTPDDEFIYNYCKAKLESDIEDTLLQLKKFDKPLNTL